jgi:hypothetical protein
LGAQALAAGILTDTWRAASPVRAMRFGLAGMRVFLDHGGRYERWQARWNEIEFLRTSRLFGERIGIAGLERVQRAIKLELAITGGEVLPQEGTLIFVREGELEVDYSARYKEIVGAGGFVGEEGVLRRGPGTWRARVTREATLARIPATEMRNLPVVMWKLLEVMDRRRCAISFAPHMQAPSDPNRSGSWSIPIAPVSGTAVASSFPAGTSNPTRIE